MKRIVCDRLSFSFKESSAREYTDEGYLKVPGYAARTGIQQYLAKEVGLDGDPMRIVNVYRPAEEVFNPESLASYDQADATNNHPGQLVDASIWKKVSVGTVTGPGKPDGDFVVVPLLIKDADAIKAIEGGKVQLSAGYESVYEHTPGVTDDGQPYELIQRDIRINHVALVDKARAGAQARIFDHDNEVIMPKVTLDSGQSVEVQDNAVAALLQNHFDAQAKAINDAKMSKKDMKEKMDNMQEQMDNMKGQYDQMKKEYDRMEDSIPERIAAIHAATESAKLVAGDKFSCDSADPVEIQRAALVAADSEIDWADKSPAYIEGAFDSALRSAKGTKQDVEQQYKQLANDGANGDKIKTFAADARAKAQGQFSGAWKKTAGLEA